MGTVNSAGGGSGSHNHNSFKQKDSGDDGETVTSPVTELSPVAEPSPLGSDAKKSPPHTGGEFEHVLMRTKKVGEDMLQSSMVMVPHSPSGCHSPPSSSSSSSSSLFASMTSLDLGMSTVLLSHGTEKSLVSTSPYSSSLSSLSEAESESKLVPQSLIPTTASTSTTTVRNKDTTINCPCQPIPVLVTPTTTTPKICQPLPITTIPTTIATTTAPSTSTAFSTVLAAASYGSPRRSNSVFMHLQGLPLPWKWSRTMDLTVFFGMDPDPCVPKELSLVFHRIPSPSLNPTNTSTNVTSVTVFVTTHQGWLQWAGSPDPNNKHDDLIQFS